MIFIAGGTGFVGGHLLKALAGRGEKVRCLVRSARKADSIKALGFETVEGEITDRQSLKGKLEGIDTVVHLVGVIEEKHGQTFQKVHVEGTRNLVEEALASGVKHFFYQSALGANPDSWAAYQKTKAQAEKIVIESGMEYTIFRPSLIIGDMDGFTKKLVDIIRSPGPVIPVPGAGRALFQPIWIGDWVKCFLSILDNPSLRKKVYELGGPEHVAYRDIVKSLAFAIGSKKPVVGIPMIFVKTAAPILGLASSEQLRLLEADNKTDKDAVGKHFGFKPINYAEMLSMINLGRK